MAESDLFNLISFEFDQGGFRGRTWRKYFHFQFHSHSSILQHSDSDNVDFDSDSDNVDSDSDRLYKQLYKGKQL